MFVLRIFDRKTHEQMQFLFTPDKSTVPFFITFIYRMLDWLRGLLSNQNLFLPLCVQKCSYVLNCSSVRGIMTVALMFGGTVLTLVFVFIRLERITAGIATRSVRIRSHFIFKEKK